MPGSFHDGKKEFPTLVSCLARPPEEDVQRLNRQSPSPTRNEPGSYVQSEKEVGITEKDTLWHGTEEACICKD